MRTRGTLTTWVEATSTGAITPADGGEAVYVHVSSMPHDGMRPRPGESLSYETETDPDGRVRAVRVWRLGDRAAIADQSRRRRVGAGRTRTVLLWVVAIAVLAAAYSVYMP